MAVLQSPRYPRRVQLACMGLLGKSGDERAVPLLQYCGLEATAA